MTVLMHRSTDDRVADKGPEGGQEADRTAIKLTPTSYLVLGMVRLGVSSGYAIKKMADNSTQNFWPVSLALIYPELARLADAGLIDRSENPRGGRARSAYTITERGVAALESWLAAERDLAVQMRDEAMLKLLFADALTDGADQLALVRRLRERNGRKSARLREEIVPQAEHFAEHGLRFVGVVARLSADLMAYAEDWLARLEAELGEEAAQEAERGGRPPGDPDAGEGRRRASSTTA